MIINFKKNKLLIFGNGYSTKFLIKRAKNYFNSITIVTRRIPHLRIRNVNYVAFYDLKKVLRVMNNSLIISTVPPNSKNEDPILKLYKNYFKSSNNIFGYISSTSVYDDGINFENSNTFPKTKRGTVRILIEKKWKKYCRNIKIFRCGGIYGIQRHPMIEYLKGNIAIPHKPNHYTNRIHVEDLANIVLHVLSKNISSTVVNVVDPNPSIGFDVISYVANSLELKKPILIDYKDPSLSKMRRSFFETSKLVKSRVINKEFNYKFLHPHYSKALIALTRDIIKKKNSS